MIIKILHSRVVFVCALAGCLVLSDCAAFQQSDSQQQNVQNSIDSNHIPAPQIGSSTDEPFLAGPPVDVSQQQPAVMNQMVTLVVRQPTSLSQVASQITQMTGISVNVDGLSSGGFASPGNSGSIGGLPPPPAALLAAAGGSTANMPTVTVLYSGPLHGLLDTVASNAGVSWRFDDGSVTFFRIETKTFIIPALAWTTNSTSQITASVGATSSGSAGDTSASDGGDTVTSATVTDIWKGLTDTAKMVGAGASVSVDPSSGTVTVTGTPDQIEQVSEWVSSISDTLAKQVAVRIQIFTVSLNHEQNYGFTPTLAFQNAAKSIGVSVSGASMPSVTTSSASPASFASSILNSATGTTGEFSGSTAAVQALDTLGQVNQVFSRDIVMLNGQGAPIQVAKKTVYLASSSTTSTANIGSTNTLTPGTVTTGFTGFVMPRIVDKKIYLGVSMTISTLDSLTTITSGSSSIQAPVTEDTVVQQTASLDSGSTLMIAGYQENDGDTTHNGVGSPYMWLLGGGGDASVKKTMLVIIVTARVL